MTNTTLAFLTDAHLGQALVAKSEIAGDKMGYEETPREHEHHLRVVLDDIARKGISKIVFGGDIGTAPSVGRFFELLRDYAFEMSLILGNHDTYGNVAQYCDPGENIVDGKLCFSQHDPHLKRIFLDTSDNILGDSQRKWLARELEGVKKAAIFLHHPILPIDTPVDRTGAALRDRDDVRSLLIATGCEISVFCGHYHMLDEAREANIRQHVTPAVSYQIIKQTERLEADTKTFGYRILEIEDAEIQTQVVLFTTA
ncbi:metallophosphoesterase family protein [Rhizobium sp. NPDC090279]|uniref:metallophosphoesterase family protein n=1 Tax=Rhizobium sp. NPDC090279 TaxID=3364499 RepID=UPI00383A19C6